jgi:hypothetical protein
MRPDHFQGLSTVLGGGNLVALALQATAEHIPAGLIVIHYQQKALRGLRDVERRLFPGRGDVFWGKV